MNEKNIGKQNKYDLLEFAKKIVEEGNLGGAIEVLTKFIEINPDDAIGYRERGELYWRLGFYDKAISDLTTSINLNSDDPITFRIRAGVFKAQALYLEAISDLTASIGLAPNDVITLRMRGEIHKLQSNYPEAIFDLTKSIEIDSKDAFTFRIMGEIYRLQGDYYKAIAYLTESIKLDPNDSISYRVRGNAHRLLGQYVQAVIDVRTSLQLAPNDDQAKKIMEMLNNLVESTELGNSGCTKTINFYTVGTIGKMGTISYKKLITEIDCEIFISLSEDGRIKIQFLSQDTNLMSLVNSEFNENIELKFDEKKKIFSIFNKIHGRIDISEIKKDIVNILSLQEAIYDEAIGLIEKGDVDEALTLAESLERYDVLWRLGQFCENSNELFSKAIDFYKGIITRTDNPYFMEANEGIIRIIMDLDYQSLTKDKKNELSQLKLRCMMNSNETRNVLARHFSELCDVPLELLLSCREGNFSQDALMILVDQINKLKDENEKLKEEIDDLKEQVNLKNTIAPTINETTYNPSFTNQLMIENQDRINNSGDPDNTSIQNLKAGKFS